MFDSRPIEVALAALLSLCLLAAGVIALVWYVGGAC